jgi:hypothetical protein
VKRTKHIIVTKRDGTLERFSQEKLSNCLREAMAEHAYEPALANPLVRAVELHLRDWQDSTPPTTTYIYRCVRSVLQQTGLSDVADGLAVHRRMRRSRRRRIRVLGEEAARQRGERWQKSALVETLQNRYGLRHAVARFLAGQIEAQVFALDYRVVSKAFLAELLRNEVLAWGLVDTTTLKVATALPHPPVHASQPEKEKH